MKRNIILVVMITSVLFCNAQTTATYTDSMNAFRNTYIHTHEVVKGKDTNYFRFFPIDINYRIIARFEKLTDEKGFIMKASGDITNRFFKYGIVHFMIHDTAVQLYIYQSKNIAESRENGGHLFLPFTDNTSGFGSHESGKYLDLFINDIKDNFVVLDFNKAYNPYCAYSPDYSCPIPPKENTLHVTIKAGEMEFAKPFH